MTKTTGILLSLFSLVQLYSYGQEKSPCVSLDLGKKTLTHVVDTNTFGWKEIEKDFFSLNGLKTKTEFMYDSLFIRIDTFIYDSNKKLIKRETLNPNSHKPYQHTTFLYDQNGSNYRTLISSIYMDWIDSVSIDTNYHHIRYDFVRDSLERFIERRAYYSPLKVPDFDTSKYEITYQTWIGDSILIIEDYSSGTMELVKKHYKDCRLTKTEFFNDKNELFECYDYEYFDFDNHGNWQLKKVFRTKEGIRNLVTTHHQEIDYY